MCVAVPGKIISINDNTAKVDFKGNRIDVSLGLVNAQVGDYVLVHAGCAIEVMKKDSALELMDLLNELEELYDENR